MNEQQVTTSDYWIKSKGGRLFARSWVPISSPKFVLTPIILLHDSLGCVQLWRSFPEMLSERTGRQVIAYDRLGFGQSDPCKNEPHVNFVREEADSYFPLLHKHFGLDRFVLFGHSVGGAMAVQCAGRFVDTCEAVITESAQAFVEDRTRQGILEAKKIFQDPKELLKLEKYHGQKTSWILKAWIDVWLSPEFAEWSLEEDLPKVKCPLLAIHGEKDEYGSVRFPEMIAMLSGGTSRKLVIPDCGHVPHREKQNLVLEEVARFLSVTPSK